MRFRFDLFLDTKFLGKNIEALGLSNKTYTALMRNGVKTVADVVNRWDEIAEMRGVGIKKVKEVKSAVFCANIEAMNERQMKKFVEDFEIVEEG